MPSAAEPTGDAAAVVVLLEWARSAGYELTSAQVGVCRVELAPRVAVTAPRVAGDAPPQSDRATIYRQFGGEAFQELTDRNELDGRGELQPVVGRR